MIPHWKHFTLEQRKTIASMVSRKSKLKDIATALGVDPTSVSKEVKKHRQPESVELGECPKTKRWPFVCDNCPSRYGKKCGYTKWRYVAANAQHTADVKLHASRKGIDATPEEFASIDSRVASGLAGNKSIYELSKEGGMPSATTLYRWIDGGIMTAKKADLPLAAGYKKRKRAQYAYGGISKVDKEGRSYADYLKFRFEFPGSFAWQMDYLGSIVSDKKEVLTLVMPEIQFPIIKILPKDDTKAFHALLQRMQGLLGGPSEFAAVFRAILTDNDPCFSDHAAIEFDPETGEKRTSVYYCDPYVSTQKPNAENMNGQLRRFFPKGSSVDGYDESAVRRINEALISRKLKSLGGATPRELFCKIFGDAALESLLSA